MYMFVSGKGRRGGSQDAELCIYDFFSLDLKPVCFCKMVNTRASYSFKFSCHILYFKPFIL